MINGTDRREDGVRAGTRRADSKVPQNPPTAGCSSGVVGGLLLLPPPLHQQLINSLVNCHVKSISHGGISMGGRRISKANGGRNEKTSAAQSKRPAQRTGGLMRMASLH
jgi:hypothetical protein